MEARSGGRGDGEGEGEGERDVLDLHLSTRGKIKCHSYVRAFRGITQQKKFLIVFISQNGTMPIIEKVF